MEMKSSPEADQIHQQGLVANSFMGSVGGGVVVYNVCYVCDVELSIILGVLWSEVQLWECFQGVAVGTWEYM